MYAHDFSPFVLPFTNLFKIRLLAVVGIGGIDWLQIMLIVCLSVIASMNILTHEYEDNLRTRQFLSFLIMLLAWSFGQFFLYEQSSEEFLAIGCVPAAILTAHFFTVKRGKYIFGFFHIALLLFIILLIIRLWSF